MFTRFEKKFTKQLDKAPTKIKEAFKSRLSLFFSHPNHPLLHNHQLVGEYKNYRSINIAGDWRAIFFEEADTVIFVALGTHSQLYK